MPTVLPDVLQIMNLWKRCKNWKTLPEPGGLLNQSEKLMEMFDVISDVVNKAQAKRNDDLKGEVEKEKLARELKHGRNRR